MRHASPWSGLRIAAWLVVCILFAATDSALAQGGVPCERAVLTLAEAADLLRVAPGELEQLAERDEVPARRVGSSWRFGCESLMAWLDGDRTHRGAPTADEMSSIAATGVVLAGQDAPIGDAPEERPAEDIFLRGQRVLLAPGEVVMDFGQFYSRSDAQELVQVGTGIALATTERRTFATLMVTRVGVLNETEVFASAAFQVRSTDQFFGSSRLAGSDDSEFVGLRVGIRHTLLREGAGRPDIILTVDGQVPVGARPSDIGAGLILVKSVDPVVLFTSASLLHTFARDLPGGGRTGPDDGVAVSMGYGLALNDTLAISASVSGLFAGGAVFNNTVQRQPDTFIGRFGLTSWLAEGLYIEPSVSFGLSGPGQNVTFGVTLPYAF
jgi:excisionase family DNA binding protein